MKQPEYVRNFFEWHSSEEDGFSWFRYECRSCAFEWDFRDEAKSHPALYVRLAKHMLEDHVLTIGPNESKSEYKFGSRPL